MDLSYFDNLISSMDEVVKGFDDSSAVVKNLLANYDGFKNKINLEKRKFENYNTTMKYYSILSDESKEKLFKTFNPIVKTAKQQYNNIKDNFWHREERVGNNEDIKHALETLGNFYKEFSDGLSSFKGQLYENKKEMKILKQTTVGNLKRKLNESKGGFNLGQGFGSETRFKSNVDTNATYNRKFDKNGGFGLGDGFTQLNEEEMVDFIANIVENMKGKTEYHNLKFVDRIANENGLFESHIKNIKNIIRNDRTPYQLKLRKYLTENVAVEMEEIYEDYSGLKLESEMMVNEIKKTFNEMKSMKKSTNESVAMTAEALDVPMEMVQKMVQIQKEAYETQMEGGQSMDITEKLCEVYEAYQNMSEGNMKPVYEELKEMMNPEDQPYPKEPSYGSLEGEEGYEDYGSRGESPYTPKELEADEERAAERWQDEEGYGGGIDAGDIDPSYALEEELCMECGDMDDESYIEVDLVSPEDFKLLPMLAKGSMPMKSSPMERPSMGMNKFSKDASMDDENMYEVPMNYSTSNPYNQYKFDTGLSRIPYGKKKSIS